jgi:FMN-dependent NADH-azoreductase
MRKILVINASASIQHSFSRKLSGMLIEKLNSLGDTLEICYRDLAETHIPHVTQRWIEADSKFPTARTGEDMEVLKTSDMLINELHCADIIVLATPMYNWSIPSSLKAYLDQVLRFNETFSAAAQEGKRYSGMLKNKELFMLFARGSQGYGKGERNEYMDHQSHYLRMVFGIMGIEKIHELAVNGTRRKDVHLDREIAEIDGQMSSLLNSL